MMICSCYSRCRFLIRIQLLFDVSKNAIRELGFDDEGLLQIGCNDLNLSLCSWLLSKTKIAQSQLELSRWKTILWISHNVGIRMGISHAGTKLILKEANVKSSSMPKFKDLEAMMVAINNIEEFKWLFLVFLCATLLALPSHLEGSHTLSYTPQEQLIGNIN